MAKDKRGRILTGRNKPRPGFLPIAPLDIIGGGATLWVPSKKKGNAPKRKKPDVTKPAGAMCGGQQETK